jgi:hypothetical protein
MRVGCSPRDGLQEATHYLGGLGGIRREPRNTVAAANSRRLVSQVPQPVPGVDTSGLA